MSEFIVRGVHDDVAKAHGQREKHLRNSCEPDLKKRESKRMFKIDRNKDFDCLSYLWIQNSVPLWLEEVNNTRRSALQSHRSDEQDDQNDIGEDGQEVGCLSRTVNASNQHQHDDHPGDEQGQAERQVWRSDSIVNVCDFL